MREQKRFAIIGGGMVGRSLAAALAAHGAPVVAVASRRLESARACAQAGRCAFATTDAAEAARRADAVVLSVPDDAVATVCRQVAEGGGFSPGDVALHLSGALGSSSLAAAREQGAYAVAFHPIQTFARPDGALFRRIVCAVEGDPQAVAFAKELARRLGARPVEVAAADKALYHAALCLACNYLVTLADAGAGLLEEAGFGQEALHALLPLLRATVANLGAVGLPRALTGPASRGDVATVSAHLEALAVRAPHLLPLYRAAGLRTVEVARRKGSIGEERARELEELLSVPQ
ncbi:MAG: Rossmann-like and DUF2520 domain-containing protein [Candidatus Brocadiia bacterium]